MSYAEKNKDRITFHKLLDFERSPAYYKMKYINRKIPEEDKEAFLIGKAFEDFLKYGEKKWGEKYEVVSRRTVKRYSEKNDNGKWELTRSPEKKIRTGIQDFLEQPLTNYDAARSSQMIECKYRDEVIGGEVDELVKDTITVEGKSYPGAISDIKTCANLWKFRQDLMHLDGFGLQYIRQLAFYQFIYQVLTDDLLPGILKVVSKEDNPMTEVFLLRPETLLQERPWIIKMLDDLVDMKRANSWPEFDRQELLRFNDAYPFSGARIQTSFTVI